jgi:hypothetical protein
MNELPLPLVSEFISGSANQAFFESPRAALLARFHLLVQFKQNKKKNKKKKQKKNNQGNARRQSKVQKTKRRLGTKQSLTAVGQGRVGDRDGDRTCIIGR